MNHTYVPVTPGVNISRLLGSARLTKKFVREVMREHPEWDWRNHGTGGAYVNGEEAVRYGLTLQVMREGTTVAMVTFQPTDANEWGYQAVVS